MPSLICCGGTAGGEFQPQRGGMFIDVQPQKISSSVRSGMETGHAAPMGLFLLFDWLL